MARRGSASSQDLAPVDDRHPVAQLGDVLDDVLERMTTLFSPGSLKS